jgi:hypothetical protein
MVVLASGMAVIRQNVIQPVRNRHIHGSLAVTSHNADKEQAWETRVARKTRKKASNSR